MPKTAPDAPQAARRSLIAALAIVLLLAAAAPFVIPPLWSSPGSPAPQAARDLDAATAADDARAAGARNEHAEATGERVAAQDLPQTDERWLLRGLVFEQGDRGVADAQVTVWAMLGGDERRVAQVQLATCRSRADGTFVVPFDDLQRFPELLHVDTQLHVVADAAGYWIGENDIAVEDLREWAADGSPAVLKIRVDRGRFLKGRIVTTDGLPLRNASVVGITSEKQLWSESCFDGTFEMELPPEVAPGQTVHLVAAHAHHGRSRAVAVQLGEGPEQRSPDLVLIPGTQGIAATVRWPDGRPAAGIEATFEFVMADDDEDIEVVHGVAVHDYHDLVSPRGLNSIDAVTDRDGRFALHDLRAGTYLMVLGDDDEEEVRVEVGQTTRLQRTYRMRQETGDPEQAQLYVDVVDRDGRRLSNADYGCRIWTGEAADIAAAQYAQQGPSGELFATATDTDFANKGAWPTLAVPRGSFCIVEASYHDAGPVYATARFAADQHRADVRIVLEPRAQTGALRFVVTKADGAPAEKVWLRFALGADYMALPIRPPELKELLFDQGTLRQHYYLLGEDGIVRGLPPGPLTVELMIEPTGERHHVLCMHPNVLQRCQVRAGATETVHVRTAIGAPITVRIAGAEVREFSDPRLYRVYDNGDREALEAFQTHRGDHGHAPNEITICTLLSYPPGRYRLEIDTRRYDHKNGRELIFEHDHRLGGGPAVVPIRGR